MTQAEAHSPIDQGRRKAIATQFRSFLPREAVLFHDDEVRPYECDCLSAYRRVPLVVVLPETVEQVQQILRFCRDAEVPVPWSRAVPEPACPAGPCRSPTVCFSA